MTTYTFKAVYQSDTIDAENTTKRIGGDMTLKTLSELEIGKTYKTCNYDVTFDLMYVTPNEVGENYLFLENAARKKIKIDFKNESDIKRWLSFMNLHEV